MDRTVAAREGTLSIMAGGEDAVLDRAGEISVPLFVASQASLVADAGVATRHGDPRL